MYSNDLILYFDGGCEPRNPGGIATYGWAITEDDISFLSCGRGIAYPRGHSMSTNNAAEYVALGKGIAYLVSQNWHGDLIIRGDSMLVVNQIKKKWKCKAKHLKPLRDRCWELLGSFNSFIINWIPREENTYCDALASKAYKEAIV